VSLSYDISPGCEDFAQLDLAQPSPAFPDNGKWQSGNLRRIIRLEHRTAVSLHLSTYSEEAEIDSIEMAVLFQFTSRQNKIRDADHISVGGMWAVILSVPKSP
jgi:hypothetical protein